MRLANFNSDLSEQLSGGPAIVAAAPVATHAAGTASMHVATAVTIADAGSFYSSSTVESALQEIGTVHRIYDEGTLVGTATTGFNFVGSNVSGTVTSGTAIITVSGGSSSLVVYDEGILVGTPTAMDFIGSGVTATLSSGTAQITVTGGTATGWSLLYDSGALAGTAASIDTGAGGIAAGYFDLVISMSLRSTKSATQDDVNVVLNNDTGSNYSTVGFYSVGTGHNHTESLATTSLKAECPAASSVSGDFSSTEVVITDYANTSRNKMGSLNVAYRKNAGTGNTAILMYGWHYASTSAISRLKVSVAGGNLEAGSSVRIWGRS